MTHDNFMEAYDKLAEKYKFVLAQLDIISSKVNDTKVSTEELIADVKKTVSDTIKEVTGIFQK